jgi:hypothetical protein
MEVDLRRFHAVCGSFEAQDHRSGNDAIVELAEFLHGLHCMLLYRCSRTKVTGCEFDIHGVSPF